LLEEKILHQLNNPKLRCCIIRGLPEENNVLPSTENIVIKNHLPEKELEQIILQSEFIIARSGYTTVMEIIALHKKSILIPTPGQTEQQYLAEKLMQQYRCYCVNQHEFVLADVYEKAKAFKYALPELLYQNNQFKKL